jgi:hypothetical protein
MIVIFPLEYFPLNVLIIVTSQQKKDFSNFKSILKIRKAFSEPGRG